MTQGSRYLWTGGLVAGVLVAVVFLLRLLRPELPAVEPASPRAQGPAKAPIQIMEYSDFQCAACRAAQPILSQLLQDYTGKIRLVFQHFPLEGHRWAPLAHHAAECAARQKRFWPFHDRLYSRQADWAGSFESPLETFIRYAKEEGLEVDTFGRCLADSGVYQKIQEEKSTGAGLGVRSTPSFFVNGKLLVGFQALRQEVERLMAQENV